MKAARKTAINVLGLKTIRSPLPTTASFRIRCPPIPFGIECGGQVFQFPIPPGGRKPNAKKTVSGALMKNRGLDWFWFLRRAPYFVGQRAIRQSLGDVDACDLFRIVKIGQCARDAQHTVIAAGGKVHGVGRVTQ